MASWLEDVQARDADLKRVIYTEQIDRRNLLRAVAAMRPFLEQEVRGCSDECPRPCCGHSPVWDVLKMLDALTPPPSPEGHDS